jgi:hypothetical protein
MIFRLEHIVALSLAPGQRQRVVIGRAPNGTARTYRLSRPPAWPVRLAALVFAALP